MDTLLFKRWTKCSGRSVGTKKNPSFFFALRAAETSHLLVSPFVLRKKRHDLCRSEKYYSPPPPSTETKSWFLLKAASRCSFLHRSETTTGKQPASTTTTFSFPFLFPPHTSQGPICCSSSRHRHGKKERGERNRCGRPEK